MNGEFWSVYGIMFIIGLVFWPRVLLLYYGAIQPQSIDPILGIMFVPRMFLASILSAGFGNTNHILVVVCQIIAGIIDVSALIIKYKFQMMTFKICKQMRTEMILHFQRYQKHLCLNNRQLSQRQLPVLFYFLVFYIKLI